MNNYVIRGGIAGKQRLESLGRVMWPTTSRLLDRVGVRPGMTCLDLGCGGGDVTFELARLVGVKGQVIGIDLDPIKLELAHSSALKHGLNNVQFRRLDISEWNEESRYDLGYSRFLLTHLGDPLATLQRLRDSLHGGGLAVIEDIDFSGHFTHPHCAAFDRYVSLYRAAVERRGGDADIGPKLYQMFQQAGFCDVNLEVVQPTFVAGEGKQIGLLTLVNIADAVAQAGLATEAELQATIGELSRFIDDPATTVSLPRIFQVWGKRDSPHAPR